MSKKIYNLIGSFAVLAFVLGPVSVSPVSALSFYTDVGVRFVPSPTTYTNTDQTVTNTNSTSNSNTSNTNNNDSNTSSNTNTSNNTNTSTNSTTTRSTANTQSISLTDGMSRYFASTGINSGSMNSGIVPSDINAEYGRLTAAAVVGSNGFWPSGIYQWILLFLILVIIITLVRYVRRSKEVYMEAPAKFA